MRFVRRSGSPACKALQGCDFQSVCVAPILPAFFERRTSIGAPEAERGGARGLARTRLHIQTTFPSSHL